jgi:hypothetical protein
MQTAEMAEGASGDKLAEQAARLDRCAKLETELRSLAAEITAAQARFLDLVGEYDTLRGWADWGARSAQDWLSNHCGHGASLAGNEVRLAHALEHLPLIRAAMGSGTLSMDKARSLAGVAVPETEEEFLNLALEMTANQLSRALGAARRALTSKEADRLRRRRFLQTWWDDDGMLNIRGRLTPEEGALFRQALEAAMETRYRTRRSDGFEDDPPAQAADWTPGDHAAAATEQSADREETVGATDRCRASDAAEQPGDRTEEASAGAAQEESAPAAGFYDESPHSPYEGEPNSEEDGGDLSADWPQAAHGAATDPWAEWSDPASPAGGGERGDERPDPAADADDPTGAARADALIATAEAYLATAAVPTTSPEHYLVIIHVDESVLVDDGDGRCHIEGGPALSADTVRRLLCGASMVWLAEDANGNPVAISDKTHDIPTSVRRAVRARDKGCVFPNGNGGRCGMAAAYSHVHHVTHRAHGGAHTVTNCRTLCSYHHHLVHEGGFTMTLDDKGAVQVCRPDGTPMPNQPSTTPGQPWTIPLDLEPRGPWARSNGERMDLAAAVDAVLGISGRLQQPSRN